MKETNTLNIGLFETRLCFRYFTCGPACVETSISSCVSPGNKSTVLEYFEKLNVNLKAVNAFSCLRETNNKKFKLANKFRN